MFLKKVAVLANKAAHNPLVRKGVHIASKTADVLNTVGAPIPGLGAINKGLHVADKVLDKINE
jgi:hypothetical protein